MSLGQNKTSRIAKNSFVLFIRMFVLMVVNLYSVRLVLRGMGTEDYGIFSLIAGLVLTLSCLTGVLSSAAQRFYSVADGLGDTQMLRDVYSTCINIALLFNVLVFVLAETVGLWMVLDVLVYPASKVYDVVLLYQFSVVSFIFLVMEIPFMSVVVARENMQLYSVISTGACLLKCLLAYFLTCVDGSELLIYGIGLMVISIMEFLAYMVSVMRLYPECKYKFNVVRKYYRNIIGFSGWTMLGTVSNMFMTQGNVMLINLFFGPIVNAAFAISQQISNAFNSFCGSIIMAIRPPMIRSYSEKNYDYLNDIFEFCNKVLYYSLLCIGFPMFCFMENILALWLGEVDEVTLRFSKLVIIYIILLSLNNPITIIVQATGKVKRYFGVVETFTLLCLPVTWVLLQVCSEYDVVFYSMIGVCALAHVLRIIIVKKEYSQFDVRGYVLRFVVPAVVVTVLDILFVRLVGICNISLLSNIVLSTLGSTLLILSLFYFVGMRKSEKHMVVSACEKVCNKFLK